MPAKYSKIGSIQQESDIARLMADALERPDILNLAAGFTDNASLPLNEVLSIANDLARENGGDRSILQYGTNQGRSGLREILSKRIEKADLKPEESYSASNVFIANGSQQILYLAVQTLCNPGDIILVEQPTYFVFLEVLRGLGVTPMPLPMMDDGDVDVDELRMLLDKLKDSGEIEKVKAVYLVSYYANPSGHSISVNAKKGIGHVLNEANAGIAVIEDAAYRELHFQAPNEVSSCLAIEDYENSPVLYTSTLTKPFASGLKVGYGYCSDRDWLQRMLSIKGQQDFGTSNFNQAILERGLEDGIFDVHLLSLRKNYHLKMKCLHEALGGELGALGWTWAEPDGGLYIWARSPNGMDTGFDSNFHRDCIKNGVMYVPGDLCFSLGGPSDRVRLSFGVLDLDEIEEAAYRFLEVAKRITL